MLGGRLFDTKNSLFLSLFLSGFIESPHNIIISSQAMPGCYQFPRLK